VDANRGGSSEESDGETLLKASRSISVVRPGCLPKTVMRTSAMLAVRRKEWRYGSSARGGSLWVNQSALTSQRRASAESDGLGIVWQPRENRERVGLGEVSSARSMS
jgi:hypothetical protein